MNETQYSLNIMTMVVEDIEIVLSSVKEVHGEEVKTLIDWVKELNVEHNNDVCVDSLMMHVSFDNDLNQVELLFLKVNIPQDKLDLKKEVI